jgi:hypothetical protein
VNQIVLEMDLVTARDLFNALGGLGEHWAAGAPIAYPSREVVDRLTALYEKLARQAELPTATDAMRSFHSGKR